MPSPGHQAELRVDVRSGGVNNSGYYVLSCQGAGLTREFAFWVG